MTKLKELLPSLLRRIIRKLVLSAYCAGDLDNPKTIRQIRRELEKADNFGK
jgi:hypothetical protein